MIVDIVGAQVAFDRLTPTGTKKYIDVENITDAATALGVTLGVADPVRRWEDDDREGEVFYHPETGRLEAYRAGWCGHRVAWSEWRAGFRVCERDGTDVDEVRGWALSVAYLAAAVDAAGIALPDTGGHTLISDGEFTDYARDWANGITDLDFIDAYVGWDAFATSLRMDYTEVGVEGGDFAGKWLVRV